MGDGPLPIVTLLAPQPLWSLDNQGRVLIASTHAYEVRAVEPDGVATVVVSERVNAGAIWVQTAASTGSELGNLEQPGGPSWHIHDAQGVRIGTLTVPEGVRILGRHGDRLVGAARSELDEASVVVYRVERGG